jgi:hypothetical protein
MTDKRYDQRGKSSLGSTADHRMRLYELAAAAASVSALALAQPAEAEIIITNKTIPIHAETPVMLDLNGDGIADFQFYLRTSSYHSVGENYLYLQKLTAGGGAIGQGQAVSALIRGAKIGPGGPFGRFVGVIENSFLCTTKRCAGGTQSGYTFNQQLYGDWGGGHPNRFIGVKFQIKGQTHYGWIRLTVTIKHKGNGHGPTGSFSATITEYGYESVANKSCGAGLPGAAAPEAPHGSLVPKQEDSLRTEPTLGMLALGADALPLWRRDDPLDSN